MLGLDFENASLQSNQDQAAVSQDDSLQSCSILQGSLSPGELGLISGPGGARESAFLPRCWGMLMLMSLDRTLGNCALARCCAQIAPTECGGGLHTGLTLSIYKVFVANDHF